MNAQKVPLDDPQIRAQAAEAIAALTEPVGPSPTVVAVPSSAREAVLQVLLLLAAGHTPKVLAAEEELTTQEAADLLNMSRPTLLKRLEEGALPYHWVGKHRRLSVVDVLRYREMRRQTSVQALQELVAEEEELGLRD